jgi:amino acid transporter
VSPASVRTPNEKDSGVTEVNDTAHAPATTLKKDSLGFLGIAFFVIAAAAPMGVFVGLAPVIFSMIGAQAPLLYAIVAAIVACFSVGYLRMSRHIPNAGGFVSYIGRGLGPRSAGAAAGVVIVCYMSFVVGIFTQYGVFFTQLVSTTLGVQLPSWPCILATIIALTFLNVRGVDLNMKVLTSLLAFEFLTIAVFIAGVLIAGPGEPGNFSAASLNPEQLMQPTLGVALIFVFSSFAGFEATAVFFEEARDPRRTVPRALYFLVFFMAAFYAIATWAVSFGIGPDRVQSRSANNLPSLIFDLAASTSGRWLSTMMQVMVVVSFMAMLLGFQNLLLRYLFTLGRAGFLHTRLSDVSKAKSPSTAAYVNAAVTGAIILGAHWSGADPMRVICSWSIALGSVSFIVVMTIAATAILLFFLRERLEFGFWATRFAPALALILTGVVLTLAVTNYNALLGDSGGKARLTLVAIPIALLTGWFRSSRKADINFQYKAII